MLVKLTSMILDNLVAMNTDSGVGLRLEPNLTYYVNGLGEVTVAVYDFIPSSSKRRKEPGSGGTHL